MPVPSSEKTVKYKNMPNSEKGVYGWTNETTFEFMTKGYVVLKNYIPKEIINMSLDAWKTVENDPIANEMYFREEDEITQNSPKESLYKSVGAYQFPPAVGLHRWLRDQLENTLDFKLCETYCYTRKYDRGAYLKAHLDRPSCEISVTICLDYKTDDNTPWKIWVQKDKNYVDTTGGIEEVFEQSQALPHRDRIGAPVSLEVGDVLIYQGPNAVHWRDTFLGDYSYHMFLHYMNLNGRIRGLPHGESNLNRGNDKRDRSSYAYDGRKDRYAHASERSDEFVKATDAWNNWDDEKMGMKSDFVNNYEGITRVEEKTKNDSI